MAAKQLDGHPGDRIGDLRTNLGMTKRELSQKTGIDASQITRIENGTLKTISSDYLIKLAKELKTSTDYILGLTSVSVPKSYDISELGLSNEAVKGLVTGTIDVGILNRLLGHKSFPRLIHLIRVYFQDAAARGIMTRNQLIELATASLSDLMKEHPEHRAEARQDLQFLNAQKMGEHEAEIEKIKNVFLAILRDIKKDMGSGELPREVATAAMLQTMRDTLAEQQREPVTMDDVAGMVVGQLGQFVPMDEETAEQFRQLAKKMMEQAGGTQNAEKP
jgi:transcriptional regulator with XRE-family HTH domain